MKHDSTTHLVQHHASQHWNQIRSSIVVDYTESGIWWFSLCIFYLSGLFFFAEFLMTFSSFSLCISPFSSNAENEHGWWYVVLCSLLTSLSLPSKFSFALDIPRSNVFILSMCLCYPILHITYILYPRQ